MGSATNQIGMMMSVGNTSTAASNVSAFNSKADAKSNSGFDSILNQMTRTVADNITNQVGKNLSKDAESIKETGNVVSEVNAKNDGTTSDNSFSETKVKLQTDKDTTVAEDMSTEADSKLQEAINEDGKEIAAKIAEELDVDEEDVIQAMQVLGLMAADLLNPDNLRQLVTTVVGEEQAADLITDSDIYTSLQDLMEGAESMKSELMNEFNLSEEELESAIADAKNNFGDMLSEAGIEDVNESAMKEANASDLAKNPNTAPQSEVISEDISDDEPIVTVKSENGGKNSHQNSASSDQNAGASNLLNQFINGIQDAVSEATAFGQVSYTDRAQMENIIRQITERISVMNSAEETSIEMALHPASLGNVNVLLQNGKDGLIAKFTAQNQIVKEAVESQMLQLQQKFEEQGIKVNSIEVTIASHAFEQNMQQEEQRQAANEEASKKNRPLRRINLAEIDLEEEDDNMSEAERIAAQMMAMNGSTVDFSA